MRYATKEDVARYQAMAEECRSAAEDEFMGALAKANLCSCAAGYDCMAKAAAHIVLSLARLDRYPEK